MLRVSEVYASVQGEGPNTGDTTVFVRFGGCNLRCPGWPCDTQHAIDPQYRNEWQKKQAHDLFEQILTVAELAGAQLITFTGGEPFLQPNKDLQWLTFALRQKGYAIECFSNGTLEYPGWAVDQISFIMDWKLPGSGEDPMHQMRLRNIEALSYSLRTQAVKFVCKDEDDFCKASSLWSLYLEDRPGITVYYGRVWNGEITNAHLAELVMTNQLPWKMNVQLHNYIWDPQERGR